jgi:hypothetical protein
MAGPGQLRTAHDHRKVMSTMMRDEPEAPDGRTIDDPVCGICGARMEPIPPVGWVCCVGLRGHQDMAAALDRAAAA